MGYNQRMRRRILDRVATPHAILVAGWLAFVIYAYPGYMSYDSVWQLMQARHLEPINEWHPPMMALIWRLTDAVIAGPFPMLVLQSATFLIGVYALLRRVMSNRAAAIVAVAVLLVPENIVVMGVIWKDSQMAGFRFAGIAALLSENRRWRVVGCVLMFLATGVRYNAAAATFPIMLGLFEWRSGLGWLRRYAIAGAVWIAITAAAFMVNRVVVEKHMNPWPTAAAPVDIAGILRFAPPIDNATIVAETPGVPWTHPEDVQGQVQHSYKPTNSYLELTYGPIAMIEYPQTQPQLDAITAAWRVLVFEYPEAFLRHRWAVFHAQLHVGGMWTGFINEPWGEDTLHHRAIHSWLQQAWIHGVEKTNASFTFRAWFFFWLGIAFLLMSRHARTAFVVLASGLTYELALFVIAPAIDYRYSHWMIVCTIIGGILLFATRRRRA